MVKIGFFEKQIVIHSNGLWIPIDRDNAKEIASDLLDILSKTTPNDRMIVHWDENSFNHQNKNHADIQG